jgi:hypothetical protein
LPEPFFLETRADVFHVTFSRNNCRKHPLAAAPADAGEVFERRAAIEVHCVDTVVLHQALRFFDAPQPFIEAYRLYAFVVAVPPWPPPCQCSRIRPLAKILFSK